MPPESNIIGVASIAAAQEAMGQAIMDTVCIP